MDLPSHTVPSLQHMFDNVRPSVPRCLCDLKGRKTTVSGKRHRTQIKNVCDPQEPNLTSLSLDVAGIFLYICGIIGQDEYITDHGRTSDTGKRLPAVY